MFEVLISPQIQYLLILQDFRNITNGFFNNFFMQVTMLGENLILLTLIAIIYWFINKKAGIFLIFNLAISVIINLFIKLSACINRPWIIDSRVCPLEEALPQADGYSFPSGHTARAMGVWGAIAYWWWNNRILRYFAITIALLIGFSRNYIGVHTPQDVLISIVLGIAIIIGLAKLLKWIEENNQRDILVFLIAVLLGIAIYIFLNIKCANQMLTYDPSLDTINPLKMKHSEYGKLGFYFGVLTGWIIERKLLNTNLVKLDIKKKIIFGILGILILLTIPIIMQFICSSILPQQILSALIKFIEAVYIIVLYPIILKYLANHQDKT